MKNVLTIGIAGGTGSGKTTISKRILKAIGVEYALLLTQDSYYRDQSHLTPEEKAKVNYDHPDVIDNDLLISHIKALRERKAIKISNYDYNTHTRTGTFTALEPKDVVIVEGILILAIKEIRDLLALKIFCNTDPDIRFIRRLKRDMSERGRSIESIVEQYLTTVRPMHIEYVEPSNRFADLIILESSYTEGIEIIIKNIKEHLRSIKGR